MGESSVRGREDVRGEGFLIGFSKDTPGNTVEPGFVSGGGTVGSRKEASAAFCPEQWEEKREWMQDI